MKEKILVSEIFGPVLQGEGALIGRPTVFVRTGGCDYRCAWCDTLYAVLPEHRTEWRKMGTDEILGRVTELTAGRPILVTLSGGNPALQPFEELLEVGREQGFTFAIETQGSMAKPWFAKLDYLVLSPKPPSSEMTTVVENVAACIAAASANPAVKTVLKVVVFDEVDYQYAREIAAHFPTVPFYLQAGNPLPAADDPLPILEATRSRLEWLLTRVLKDGWLDVTILPQLHALLYGSRRGV